MNKKDASRHRPPTRILTHSHIVLSMVGACFRWLGCESLSWVKTFHEANTKCQSGSTARLYEVLSFPSLQKLRPGSEFSNRVTVSPGIFPETNELIEFNVQLPFRFPPTQWLHEQEWPCLRKLVMRVQSCFAKKRMYLQTYA